MRTNVSPFLCLFILLLAICSCKKQDSVHLKDNDAGNTGGEKVKAWFSSVRGTVPVDKQNASAREISNKADPRDGSPEWSKTVFYEKEKIYVTPIEYFSTKNEKFPSYKFLVSSADASGDIKEGVFFYLMIDDNKTNQSFKDLLPGKLPGDFFTLQHVPKEFSGTVIKYDLNYRLTHCRKYEGGVDKKQYSKILSGINNKYVYLDDPGYVAKLQEIDPNQGFCVDEWIIWYVEDEETGQPVTILGIDYIGSTCFLPQGGSGNPSGPVSTPPDENNVPAVCNLTMAEAMEQLNAVTGTDELEANYPSDQEGGGIMLPPDGSGRIRRGVLPYAGLASLNFYWGEVPHYAAFFSGVLYKINQNDTKWKWESCKYTHTALYQGELPPCTTVRPDVDVSDVIISGDKIEASAFIAFRFYVSVKVGQISTPEQLAYQGGNRNYKLYSYMW